MHICKGVSELYRASELWISLVDDFLQRMKPYAAVTSSCTYWGACRIWDLQELLLIVLQLIVGPAFRENYLTVWLQESVYKCWLLVNLIKRLQLHLIATDFIHKLLSQLEKSNFLVIGNDKGHIVRFFVTIQPLYACNLRRNFVSFYIVKLRSEASEFRQVLETWEFDLGVSLGRHRLICHFYILHRLCISSSDVTQLFTPFWFVLKKYQIARVVARR